MKNNNSNLSPAKYTYIIPVYNVENYLETCIDSLLSQSFNKFEIILVDDGSSDKSSGICDSYEKKYQNVKAIHKNNGGASSARNVGLKKANTEYIIFVDSDDYWADNDGLKKIDRIISKKQPDLLCFGSKKCDEDSTNIIDARFNYPNYLNNMPSIEAFKELIKMDIFTISPPLRVYKKDFLISNKLFFLEGIRAEDIELGFRIIDSLPKYAFLDEKIYMCRRRKDSVSHSIGVDHLKEFAWIIDEYAKYEFNPKIKEYAMSYLSYQYCILLAFLSMTKTKECKTMLKKMKKHRHLFSYKQNPKVKRINNIYKLFGYKTTCWALGIYLNKKWTNYFVN